MIEQLKEKKLNTEILIKSSITTDLTDVLSEEADAINYLIDNFPTRAQQLVEKILQTKGRVVFSGMGKSGLVAKKLVATFSSTGTPSLFLHPSEALHGDLGMLKDKDLFIAISKSGSGIELEQVLPILKSRGNITSLISCANGSLNSLVDLSVVLPFKKEACQLNLAPTSSSTLCMAFGDALGVVVSKIKGFGKNDFAKFHPAGTLGKKLLLKVCSLMHGVDVLPFINVDAKFKDLLLTITSKKLGVGVVVDHDKKLLGIITDGDLRRACEHGQQVFEKTADLIMTKNPQTLSPDILAFDALQKMEEFNITSLVVTQKDNTVVGLIHIHDLLKAGLVVE